MKTSFGWTEEERAYLLYRSRLDQWRQQRTVLRNLKEARAQALETMHGVERMLRSKEDTCRGMDSGHPAKKEILAEIASLDARLLGLARSSAEIERWIEHLEEDKRPDQHISHAERG